MKTALVFPGQGAQHPGMAKDIYEGSELARDMFSQANELLGFDITQVMFEGTEDELKKTSITQPAIYLHSVILAKVLEAEFEVSAVAGHSLGEFSALANAGVFSFLDGLQLVSIRANAMQKACDLTPSTMGAIIGLDDAIVDEICAGIDAVVVPANYNSVGQLVISGSEEGVTLALAEAKEKGAKMTVPLKVDGAFHSPFMEPARAELAAGIEALDFQAPRVPVYQNVSAQGETDPAVIKANLVKQLTAPVRWTQTIQQMLADGHDHFTEVGPGSVLQGLIKRIDRKAGRAGRSGL